MKKFDIFIKFWLANIALDDGNYVALQNILANIKKERIEYEKALK